jgi:hypothetical protein
MVYKLSPLKSNFAKSFPNSKSSPIQFTLPISIQPTFAAKLRDEKGCQIFLNTILENGGKLTKWPQNYQITIKYTKWQ